jgi:hypothetical protein
VAEAMRLAEHPARRGWHQSPLRRLRRAPDGTITTHPILQGMAIYTLMPRQDGDGYDIRVVEVDGARHTMLGFKTEADAMAWIAHDKELEEAAARLHRSNAA